MAGEPARFRPYRDGPSMISLIARLLLIVPSLIAGWFVSKDNVAYWIVAFAIGLVFIALTIVFEIYVHPLLRRRSPPEADK